MPSTRNTLVSTPNYPALPVSTTFTSEPALHAWQGGEEGALTDVWRMMWSPTIEVETFPQGTAIPNSDFELRYAIVVQKQITRDGIVIRSGSFDEEAFGVVEEDAYLDFLTSLRDRYNSLRWRESSLSAQDSSVLNKLRDLLGPKEG
jgi:hypothetical protein